jgi:hypothetical protein
MSALPAYRQTFHPRVYRRFLVQCLLYFSGNALYGTGSLWNISLDGCRVDSDVNVAAGITLTLFVMLPDEKEGLRVDQALVCSSRGHEFGLVIREMNDQDWVRLWHFIAELL